MSKAGTAAARGKTGTSNRAQESADLVPADLVPTKGPVLGTQPRAAMMLPEGSTLLDVTLKLPILVQPRMAWCPTHVDAHLSRDEAWTVRELLSGLRATMATLKANGRFIESATDALRWLAEQIAEAVSEVSPDVNIKSDTGSAMAQNPTS